MSIGVTAEEAMFEDATSRWVQRHVPREVRRACLGSAHGAAVTTLWRALATQGLLGPHLPEAAGGAGGSMVTLAVALEQLGQGMAPGPILGTVATSVLVDRYSPEATRAELLPQLADGTAAAAVALDSGSLALEASERGFSLSGQSAPLPGIDGVDLVILPARAGEELRWVLIGIEELEISHASALDPSRSIGTARADRVTVPDGRILAIDPPQAVFDILAALAAAEAAGVAAWCLETASDHACTRRQFGRPIGQFQAVKHLCADMLIRVEQARAVAWDAAHALDDPEQRALASAVAAAVAIDAAVSCAKDCIQILGGIGFTWEHDAHLYLKRAAALRQYLGSGHSWRRQAAAQALAGVRRVLRLDLGAEAEPIRGEVRGFLGGIRNLEPTEQRRRLAEAGYLVPYWPRPWGREARLVEQLVIEEEFEAAGIPRPDLVIGNWVLPTLIHYGTDAQKKRFIWPTLLGEISWCQMFSEPEAGSDLASLRTRAERVENGWVLNGQKLWTSLARESDWGICLARTDTAANKHDGITYFLIDMSSPGLDIRPLRELTGAARFSEIFLNDVFVPEERVVGEVNGGWKAARTTLANERVAMSKGSTMGRGVESVLAALEDHPDSGDALVRDRLAALVCEGQTLTLLGFRTTLRQLSGVDPGAASSVRKLVGMRHAQDCSEFALLLSGANGLIDGGNADEPGRPFLRARSLTIAGGTTQVQRNIVAERMLGLPRDA